MGMAAILFSFSFFSYLMVRFTLSPQRTDTQRVREDHPFHVSKPGYETIPLLSKTKIQAISHLFCAWFVSHLVINPSRFSHNSFFGLRVYFPSQQFFSHVRMFSWFIVVLSNVDEVSYSTFSHDAAHLLLTILRNQSL